jgi:indolepyruvate ferredoxin oxidoreductase
MTLAAVRLDDKYTLEHGRVFLTGMQALIRLPMLQRARDLREGRNTAGFISGYRGSPLAGYDIALWRAKPFLEKSHIRFEPGVNEDLAATAVWGSQQVNLFRGAKYDGVFGIWYGKGPGVDRSLDAFKHANSAGTAKYGGVLALLGDDHGAQSSTLAHQSEHDLIACMIPVLYPASIQEYLDYGLLGWAMSRYAGLWIGVKCVSETVESSASVAIDPDRMPVQLPADFEMPPGGLNIRWPDDRLDQEYRLHRYKIGAALAFARANGLDRLIIDSPKPRFGIIASGKSYLDVRQALDDLGIDEAMAAEFGLRLYKVGMVWPLEREGVRAFAEGLEEVLVVEEKRALIEHQLKEQLYNWREEVRPRVIGKHDEQGEWLLPPAGELTPAMIAKVIARRIGGFVTNRPIEERIAFIDAKEQALTNAPAHIKRLPYYCAGCPHNTSTTVPEGSRALAGIGCHFMAIWMDRNTATFTQMGGEGATWIGQAPFTDEKHVFVNLGDGTYYHSGLLAIRAAVAAKANITYKILYNDAVAMTGGQPVEGGLTVAAITQQLHGEGVGKTIIVTDEPHKYGSSPGFAPGVTVRHRDDLDAVQRELRDEPGVSALIYDQTCAAEKRRRRKRAKFPDPPKRVFINDLVCEGCGDCSVKSNCIAVEPLETEWGRKRRINQSVCNKDYSCLKGFCPSFVTVHGGRLRRGAQAAVDGGRIGAAFAGLPAPKPPALDRPYSVLITGIGGTGVVTIGAILGMAAHLEGRGVSVLDMTGLAQKNGAVLSHVRIALRPEDIHAVRIASGGADLVLGCDMVVAASGEAIGKMQSGHTSAIINSHLAPTADFTLNPDADFHVESLKGAIATACGPERLSFVEATTLATALVGEALATNMFMLGYAYQKGLIPVAAEALERAIELNGAWVEGNKQAFAWGRLAADQPKSVEDLARPAIPLAERAVFARSLDEIVWKRVEYLTDYQNAAYARRYAELVDKARAAEAIRAKGLTGLAEAVARYGFKLMAYKDEYEVARLYAKSDFLAKLGTEFEGDYRLEFHLAPPVLARRDPITGELKKRAFGPWILTAFALLARLKFLRGTALDPFARTPERRAERQLIEDYFALVDVIAARLTPENYRLAVALAEVPEKIRGYGHVKMRSLAKAKAEEAELKAAFLRPAVEANAAE